MLSATASYPSLPAHPVPVSAGNHAKRDTAVSDQPNRDGRTARNRAIRQAFWRWARIVGGGAILALVLWRVGTAAFLDGLRVLDGRTLAVAFGIGLLTTFCSAWRWCLVARGLGIRLPLFSAVADYYRALFLNAALPGGVLGDVHRAVRHGRDVGDVGRGVRAVVLERTAGQLTLVAVSVVVLLAHPASLRTGLELVSAAPPATVAVAALAVAALTAGGIGFGVVAQRRRRATGTSRWARALRTATVDVRRGLFARGNWPWIVFSSALVLAGHLATFVVAARTAGASAPIGRLVPLMLLALVAMTLPLNVGGWGPREGVCAWAFAAVGLNAAQGLTVAVVYGLLAFVASLPGAGVLPVRWALSRQASSRQASSRQASFRLAAQPAPNRSDSA